MLNHTNNSKYDWVISKPDNNIYAIKRSMKWAIKFVNLESTVYIPICIIHADYVK